MSHSMENMVFIVSTALLANHHPPQRRGREEMRRDEMRREEMKIDE